MSSMLLITSNWGPTKTFKMIPITKDCPYNEVIFDVQTKTLAIIGKESKESFHMVPKLNDVGDIMRLKVAKKENGKDYAEERKLVSTFYEYYITERDEIESFLSRFAINFTSFDYNQYLNFEMPTQSATNNVLTIS